MQEFYIEKLFDTEYILVANEKKRIKEIKEINDLKVITSDNYKFTTMELEKVFKEYNLELNQSMTCSITEARINAAKMGLGISYVIKTSVQEELEKGELYEVKLPIKLPKTSVNLIYLKDRLTKVDKKFINRYLTKSQ